MPIKINLLAEAQAADEIRRRDPVKRAAALAALLVIAMLLWAGWIYWNVTKVREEQAELESTWKSIEKGYQQVSDEQKFLQGLQSRIASLDRYETNRFLWSCTLNAFQQSITPPLLDKIQVTRINGSHTYQFTEAVPPKKKGDKMEPGQPASSREKISITVDARDYGNPAEQNYNRYKTAISSVPYFSQILPEGAISLKTVNPVVRDLTEQKEFIGFTLELQIPPTTRNE